MKISCAATCRLAARLDPPTGCLAVHACWETHTTPVSLQAVRDAGINSLAVVFKHAAIFPDHEQLVGRVARACGFTQVSLSSEVMQMVKMVPRGYTATADAYLTPHIMR